MFILVGTYFECVLSCICLYLCKRVENTLLRHIFVYV
jgi:hypothetical protein